jgi:hypothetical protein
VRLAVVPKAFVLLFVLVACERKAPGPAECREFALRVAGVKSRDALATVRERDQLDELTRRCLVTPFDHELLRCVEETGAYTLCQVEYRRRHAER